LAIVRRKRIGSVPYYYFEAATAEGKIRKQILKARDRKAADHRLRESGLRPMLIENYRTTKKKKKRKALHTRHIVRNSLLVVVCISLVGGVAAYMIILDIGAIEGLTVEKLATSGIMPGMAPGIIESDTPEGREYANSVLGILNTNYPDSFSGATIRRKSMMVIYVKKGNAKFTDEFLDSIATMITHDFQREFKTSSCTVFINMGDDETLAESRYRRGQVTTEVY
jgi:hypothetical protein